MSLKSFTPPSDQIIKNQAKLIVKTFGLEAVKPKFFRVNENQAEEDARFLGDEGKDLSKFGLPVFDALEISRLSYKTLEGKDVVILSQTFATVLIDISQSKNIVTTPINGRNGTVKEYMSDGDDTITIRGVLVGDGIDVRPDNLISGLIAFCKAPVPLDVYAPCLFSQGIYSMVVNDYTIRQLEGKRNVVPFELLCTSDTPFEIEQKNASTI